VIDGAVPAVIDRIRDFSVPTLPELCDRSGDVIGEEEEDGGAYYD
jgi:hypothetical protein